MNLWEPSTLPPPLRFAAAINFRARANEDQHWNFEESWNAYLYKPLGIYLYPALKFNICLEHKVGEEHDQPSNSPYWAILLEEVSSEIQRVVYSRWDGIIHMGRWSEFWTRQRESEVGRQDISEDSLVWAERKMVWAKIGNVGGESERSICEGVNNTYWITNVHSLVVCFFCNTLSATMSSIATWAFVMVDAM